VAGAGAAAAAAAAAGQRAKHSPTVNISAFTEMQTLFEHAPCSALLQCCFRSPIMT